VVGGAGVIDQAGRFLLSVVAAGVLGPIVFGSWSLIATVIQYSNVLSLGVAAGASRAIPVERGAGRDDVAARLEGAAREASLATSVLAGAVAGVFVALTLGGTVDALVPLIVACAVAIQQQVVLDQSLLRSRFAFRRAGSEAAANGIAGLVAGLLLLPWGVAGLAGSRIVAAIAALGVGWPVRNRLAPRAWDATIARDLVQHGLPLVVAATMFGLLITVDRWLVLVFYGDEALGQFSLASIVFAGLLMISTLVSQQHLARTAFGYGRERDVAALRWRAGRQGLVALAITAPAALVVISIAGIVVPRWLPAYEAALVPMAISAAGASIYAPMSGYPNVLGIVRRGRRLLFVQAGSVLALVFLSFGSFLSGLGLPGISLATSLALGGYGTACVWATRGLRDGRRTQA
jgi:O-antigen/teichoic acid export membrane protein